MIDYKEMQCCQPKIFKSKIESCPVKAGNIAFHSWQIGLQTWFWSIQNHALHCFQAFACCHLKSLCCLIWIWADSLSYDRSHFICDLLGCKCAQPSKVLTLDNLHLSVLTSFIKIDKALTKFNEALTKSYHGDW